LAEISEHKRFGAGVSLSPPVKIARPPIGTQLARPENEDIAANDFNPFHKSHLPHLEWPQVPGDSNVNNLA
jgi:hypothetical protein